jgi:hypothetical protein
MSYRRPGFLAVVWFVANNPVVTPSFAGSLLLLQLRPCVDSVLLLLSTLLRLATIPMITALHDVVGSLLMLGSLPLLLPAVVGVVAITDIPALAGIPAIAFDLPVMGILSLLRI